jgi:[ribulose-bisphosphate carboxylase]-lysine N-methyltransferase
LHSQERARGADSAWAPYLAALPPAPPTPLCWSDAELAALKGTTLADAVAAQRRTVAHAWQRLAPLAHAAARAAGVASPALREADLAWATGVFWSRALAFPDMAALAAASADAGAPPTPLAEGIVPGLDFCNHARGAPARWTLLGARAATRAAQQPPRGVPTTLALQESGRAPPLRRGREVRISYGGGRANEELLFCYGFAEAGNEADALMLSPPVPPLADWDAATAARMALLHARGLAPRAFLPLAALRGASAAGTPAQAIEGACVMRACLQCVCATQA